MLSWTAHLPGAFQGVEAAPDSVDPQRLAPAHPCRPSTPDLLQLVLDQCSALNLGYLVSIELPCVHLSGFDSSLPRKRTHSPNKELVVRLANSSARSLRSPAWSRATTCHPGGGGQSSSAVRPQPPLSRVILRRADSCPDDPARLRPLASRKFHGRLLAADRASKWGSTSVDWGFLRRVPASSRPMAPYAPICGGAHRARRPYGGGWAWHVSWPNIITIEPR